MKKMFWIVTIMSVLCVAASYGQYNDECWFVSGGATVGKLYPDGTVDQQAIGGLTQVSAAEVNPADGVVWFAINAGAAADAVTVYRYNPSSGELTPVPGIEQPSMISINPVDGAAWIAGKNAVKKISGDGTQVLATIEAHEPAVAVNPKDGSAWITNARGPIARYDAAGNKIADAPPMGEPKGVTVDYQGNAWVADSQHSVLVRLSADGQKLVELTDIPNPMLPRVNVKDGSVWVVSQLTMQLINLSADGTKLTEFPAGVTVVAISVSPKDGGIWVADLLGATFTGEVCKYSATGQKLFANPIPQPSSVSVGYWEP